MIHTAIYTDNTDGAEEASIASQGAAIPDTGSAVDWRQMVQWPSTGESPNATTQDDLALAAKRRLEVRKDDSTLPVQSKAAQIFAAPGMYAKLSGGEPNAPGFVQPVPRLQPKPLASSNLNQVSVYLMQSM